jgi:2-methylisocitrate lyase-like PEP mutase family enzyme
VSTHLDDPATDLELSDAEFERLGYALYTYGVMGFHRALYAAHTNLGFANDEDKSRAIDKLNRQNERAFTLFKQLEQCRRGVSWMVWPQANMEHRFAPAR